MSPTVQTAAGTIKGRALANQPPGREAAAFLGIPYAEPPVGELRFKKTVPIKDWDGIKECTKFGPHAPYCHLGRDGSEGSSEDCLYLNVFAPTENAKPKRNLPVLVYIHGGGFMVDSSDLIGDERIGSQVCARDVIVVTFNYRLGIVGFAAIDGFLNGNYGLWDMTEALRWIVNNISAFGGDPTRITVGGQSAGAVAADLLALSPHSRDLFQQLLLFAGSADCFFSSRTRDLLAESLADWAADVLGYDRNDGDAKLVEILKTADIHALVPGMMLPDKKQKALPLGPVLDGDFFPKPLDELRAEAPPKKVVIGVTEHECLTFARMYTTASSMRDSVPLFVRMIAPGRDASDFYPLYDAIVDSSLDDADLAKFRQFVKFLGTLFFGLGHYKTVSSWLRRGSDVFQFCFKYFKPGTNQKFGRDAPFDGASHCLELPYLFGCNLLGPFEPNERDENVIRQFAGFLCNFFRTGNPNSDELCGWQSASLEHVGRHFEFDQKSKMTDASIYESGIEDWCDKLKI